MPTTRTGQLLIALGRGGGWGVRYPKAPSRIAREGFLTEGASSPPHRAPHASPAKARLPRDRGPGKVHGHRGRRHAAT